MTEGLGLMFSLVVGLILGTFFFGGLWWTVKRGFESPAAVWWFIGSGLLRFSTVIVGFYYLGQGSWQRMLIGLGGFFIAKLIIVRLPRIQKAT